MKKTFEANVFYETSLDSNQIPYTGSYRAFIKMNGKPAPDRNAQTAHLLGCEIRCYDDSEGNTWLITNSLPTATDVILTGGRLEKKVTASLRRPLSPAELIELTNGFSVKTRGF